MPISAVYFAPRLVPRPGKGGPATVASGVSPGNWFRMAFRREDSSGLPLVLLGARLLGLRGRGFLGNSSALDPGVSLRLLRAFVRQGEELGDSLDVVCL